MSENLALAGISTQRRFVRENYANQWSSLARHTVHPSESHHCNPIFSASTLSDCKFSVNVPKFVLARPRATMSNHQSTSLANVFIWIKSPHSVSCCFSIPGRNNEQLFLSLKLLIAFQLIRMLHLFHTRRHRTGRRENARERKKMLDANSRWNNFNFLITIEAKALWCCIVCLDFERDFWLSYAYWIWFNDTCRGGVLSFLGGI